MPDVREHSEDVGLEASVAEDDKYTELLLAGFRACAREALRFLLEEEGLSPDHPLPAGLNEHLVRQQCHLAGALHNDSGVDLDESFLHITTDGDTTAPNQTTLNSSEFAADLLETIFPNLINDSFIAETDGRTMNSESTDSENDLRIEMVNTNQSTELNSR